MNTNKNTRYTLIERLQLDYNDASWEDFAATYQNYILAIIRRLGAADADIDDLMQQVLIEIWKGVVKYERRKSTRFRNWLSTVTRHTVYRFYRKQNKGINADELINQPDIINAEIEGLIEDEWNEFIELN